jgi:hypothetical protein
MARYGPERLSGIVKGLARWAIRSPDKVLSPLYFGRGPDGRAPKLPMMPLYLQADTAVRVSNINGEALATLHFLQHPARTPTASAQIRLECDHTPTEADRAHPSIAGISASTGLERLSSDENRLQVYSPFSLKRFSMEHALIFVDLGHIPDLRFRLHKEERSDRIGVSHISLGDDGYDPDR